MTFVGIQLKLHLPPIRASTLLDHSSPLRSVCTLWMIHWQVFCKKGVLFCQVSILRTLVDLSWTKKLFSQDTFFFQVILPKIRTSSFSQEFRCPSARKYLFYRPALTNCFRKNYSWCVVLEKAHIKPTILGLEILYSIMAPNGYKKRKGRT